MASRYIELGVDIKKRGIEVFEHLLDNLYPHAFCTVVKDPDDPDHGLVLHTDGAGSKPVQSYLHWRETEEVKWFTGLAQDILAMNLDDVICVGAQPLCFIDYVALNPFKVPKADLLRAIATGLKGCLETLRKYEVKLLFAGGETADLPDQLRTLDVSGAMLGRVELSEALTGDEIKPGATIVGLRSGGRTKYEDVENSGIMCNGITLARHCLINRDYQLKYPELGEPGGKGYYGKFAFDDYLDELGMTVGEAVTSPTRLFAPVLKRILERCGAHVKGMVHNTGGGQTKCMRLGENIHYVKDNPIDIDPIFRLIQEESGEPWSNMYEGFNMGTGFEVIADTDHADEVISVSESFGVGAQVIGRCEKSEGGNRLTIHSPFGRFCYS